jgi:hypothetical protein
VARRGVGRTEVDDDFVPPPKYLRRRGTGWHLADVDGLVLGWCWARQLGCCGQVRLFSSLFFSVFISLLYIYSFKFIFEFCLFLQLFQLFKFNLDLVS